MLRSVCLPLMALLISFHANAAMKDSVKPWLGIGIENGKQGVLVKNTIPGTPAENAGFLPGDEILKVQGKQVRSPEEMIKTIQSFGVGNQVKIEFLRAGKSMSKDVALVARPDEEAMLRQRLEEKPAPMFSAIDVKTGASIESNTLKGQVILYEFWAPWCPACLASHQRLSEFAKANAGKIRVVGISEANEEEDVKAYIKKTNPTFEVWSAKSPTTMADYAVIALPTLVVVDRDGLVKLARLGAGQYVEDAIEMAEKLATNTVSAPSAKP